MTWKNYGKEWQIDHIIPISAFNFTSFKHIDFKKCWSLRNLRPLWSQENNSKSNKLDKSFQPSFLF
jgi:5-methylcytosine-specific restriction endonuclease McrA